MSKGFICICIVPLEVLKNSSFCLSHILLFAGYARNGLYQIGNFTCEVPFVIICDSCNHAGDCFTTVQVWTIPAFLGFAGILNEVQNVYDLNK